MMTTGQLAEIRRLNQAGKHDAEIAERLGVTPSAARYWRRRMGLEKVKGYQRRRKQYAVYDGGTETLAAMGTAWECAAALGVTVASLRAHMSRAKRGQYQKYTFWEVRE